ncbi:MAG: dephospho-CoA kinase [Acidiferrobacteraceae bacterium]
MQSQVFRVGLTGGIGSGKSHVASLFAALGVPLVDADEMARSLTVPGTNTLAEIRQRFGPEVLDTAGALRRDILRRRVFEDPQARRALEQILHPRIRERMNTRVQTLDTAYCLMIIPLLVETGMRDLVDRVLVIDADPAIQIARVERRSGLSRPEIARILDAQADRGERLRTADDVIVNDVDGADLTARVHALHRKYLALAGADGG